MSALDPTGPDPAVMEAINKGNAVVFLDVTLGEGDNAALLGRIKLELFVQDVSTALFLYEPHKYTSNPLLFAHMC
jgi:hypothetical protein